MDRILLAARNICIMLAYFIITVLILPVWDSYSMELRFILLIVLALFTLFDKGKGLTENIQLFFQDRDDRNDDSQTTEFRYPNMIGIILIGILVCLGILWILTMSATYADYFRIGIVAVIYLCLILDMYIGRIKRRRGESYRDIFGRLVDDNSNEGEI